MATSERQIAELEAFFTTAILPQTIQLDSGTYVNNVSMFLESHLAVLRSGGSKPIYDVFYLRLLRLKELVSQNP